MTKFWFLMLRALFIASGLESAAWAYIDPATSGLLMQIFGPILIAVVAFWQRLKTAAALVLARFGWNRRDKED